MNDSNLEARRIECCVPQLRICPQGDM